MSKRKKRKRHPHHHKKIVNPEEEYAIEITPNEIATEKKEDFLTKWFRMPTFSSSQFIGYFALFLSLLSLGFYPLLFGLGGIILGIFSIVFGEKTIGYTAIAFSTFSLLFDLLYRLTTF
ncbi:MAG: permease [Bacillaceae bacterium]